MRRSLLLRILIAAWGFWFAAACLELPGVHVCAVHSAKANANGHHAHHHGAPAPDGQHCTCLGQCGGSSPALLAATPVVTEAGQTDLPQPSFAAPTFVVSARPYAQPFANGPPLA